MPRSATLPSMKIQRRPVMTVKQFLDWEKRQEARYEFDGFRPVLMAGGTEAQAIIQSNILGALNPRLRGTPCRVIGSDLKIAVMGRIRYPDAFVVRSPSQLDRTVVTDPVIVFEILSESTQHTDLVEKNDEYRETPSIQRYVVLEQTHIGGIVFARSPDGHWLSNPLNGPKAILELAEIDITLSLGEFYAGMNLATPDTEPVPTS